jgi:DNA-binding Xre family transcriptional regulator
MNKTELRAIEEINTLTLAKPGKNKPVSVSGIMKICEALDCGVETKYLLNKLYMEKYNDKGT